MPAFTAEYRTLPPRNFTAKSAAAAASAAAAHYGISHDTDANLMIRTPKSVAFYNVDERGAVAVARYVPSTDKWYDIAYSVREMNRSASLRHAASS